MPPSPLRLPLLALLAAGLLAPSSAMAALPDRPLPEGGALLACRATAKGQLRDCRVVYETPRGAGFGKAALGLAGRMKMKPTTDGQPRSDELLIPVAFGPPSAGRRPVFNAYPGGEGRLVYRTDGGAVEDTVACLEAARCRVEAADWAEDGGELRRLEIAERVGDLKGKSMLDCAVGADGVLGGCRTLGTSTPEAEAVMAEVAGLFRMEAGKVRPGARVLLTFDWTTIAEVRAAIAADAARRKK